MRYLRGDAADRVSADLFQKRRPYLWVDIQATLSPEGFECLHGTLPDFWQFEQKVGIKRAYGQAPHDWGILHYRPGLDLPQPWIEFIAELHGETYQRFLRRVLALPPRRRIILSMEVHYAWQGCAPAFDELETATALGLRGKGSLLFQRTEDSWHGVRLLGYPSDVLRRLFVVSVNLPTVQVGWGRGRGRDLDRYLVQQEGWCERCRP